MIFRMSIGFLRVIVIVIAFVITSTAEAELKEAFDAIRKDINCDVALPEIFMHAEAGSAVAQDYLGQAYEQGYCLPKTYMQSLHWFLKAAERGNAHAQSRLGSLEYMAKTSEPTLSFSEQAEWEELSAEQGYAPAQLQIAGSLFAGFGVKKDLIRALMWSILAESAGDEKEGITRKPLGKYYYTQNQEFKNKMIAIMTADEIKQSRNLSHNWLVRYKKAQQH